MKGITQTSGAAATINGSNRASASGTNAATLQIDTDAATSFTASTVLTNGTGGTSVEAGTLVISGGLAATGNLSVSTNATFVATASLSVANVSLESGAILGFDLDTTSSLAIGGDLTQSGGDPALFRRAAEMERQFRDVAVPHASPSSMWIQPHAAGTHTTGHFHVGHFWSTGMIWHYLLTGDRRSYDTARGTAADL